MFVAVYTGACQDANQGVSTTLKELIIMPLVNSLFLTHRETVDMFNGWLAALQGEPMNNDVATGLASAFHVGVVARDALFVSIVSEEPLSAEALTEYVENYEKPEARDFSWSIFDKYLQNPSNPHECDLAKYKRAYAAVESIPVDCLECKAEQYALLAKTAIQFLQFGDVKGNIENAWHAERSIEGHSDASTSIRHVQALYADFTGERL